MNLIRSVLLLLKWPLILTSIFLSIQGSSYADQNHITILFDAFGKPSSLIKDWGFAALVEFNGKKILFDTGNNAEIFEHNVSSLDIDLSKLDFVILSHRHGDHTSGMNYLKKVNPKVVVYTPHEISAFGTPFSKTLMTAVNETEPKLPANLHYFNGLGKIKTWPSGSPWPNTNFIQISKTTEISKGIFLISTISDTPGTKEMQELSLAIQTEKGLILVVGCSHPGIREIVQEAAKINKKIYIVFGGFHLIGKPREEIDEIAISLHDKDNIEFMAPGHCTGVHAFYKLRELYQKKYLEAGLGTVISLPEK